VRSFDAPRERPAPRLLIGHSPDGEWREFEVRRTTLVVAVKPHCDGCRAFLEDSLDGLSTLDVVFVSATDDEEWRSSRHPVLIAPNVLEELEIRSAPFYVLIDASSARVVAEGSLFSPTQVAQEIAAFSALWDVTDH
jgi:hypothetical protein